MATSLRALASQPSHSPTSSISEHSTTPTSPHFAQHAQRVAHPYSSSSSHLDSRLHSTTLASIGPGGSSGTLTRASSIQHPRPPSPPLLRPSPGSTFSQHLKGWGHAEVAQWLAIYKCGHHAPLFQRNDIDGNVLLDVDMASLKEMGIAKVGERVKLLSGIKDLRKRAAAQGSVQPRVELRLNGAATPPLDDVPRLERPREGVAARRLNSGRPPPLDLHNHSARNLPQVYQPMLSATPRQRTTPRPIAQPPARPTLQSQNSSNTTVTQASVSSVPAPSRPNNLNLRAPPPRDPGRRSPSPVNDASSFLDRPLPPAPTGSTQSSAAEYASSIAQSRQNSVSTPTWAQSGQSYGVPKGPAPSSLAERRAASQQSLNAAARTEHRKVPSLGTSSGSKTSPIKNKFAASGLLGRSATPVHPFAASRDDKASPPQVPSKESPPTDYAPTLGHSRTATGGQLSGTTSTIARLPPRKDSATSAAPISLEDLRRQLVKFVNAEDGTMKTVNVSSCVSGVEVLERVLKKFNKWHTGNVSTDTESDEDGERLEVDGWGVYTDDLDPDAGAKPLSDAALLGICLAHRDGSAIRDKALVLRRTRRLGNRKNMEDFLGGAPPPPMSPASPTTYFSGPRLGISQAHSHSRQQEDDVHLTPGRAASKKTNRASTVSVMSGLGVPMADMPPSPSIARSPSSSSFLPTRKKMYNFFGHRPPSELISSHLAEYFPSAKKRELEKTVRHSMLRLSSGGGLGPRRGSIAPSIADSRRSIEALVGPSPPRKNGRPGSRGNLASPPTASIPEETETGVEERLPRVSVSNDGGEVIRASIDGESEDESVASIESRPPLLPPFETGGESFADSLQAFGPRIRPKSIIASRRGSTGSTKSRMSMLSQIRRNRDRTDTASLLTVDEITAEVENRRASTITFEESDEETGDLSVAPRVADTGLPVSESEESEEEMESEEDSEEESDEDEDDDEGEADDADEDELGKAFTSTGSKRIIKWIKGALIGAGSFGSVFLGMDAQSGLLMAVKQVELPTGSARNEERKRTMVEALEREIELLKELQHENIVQYLDSSADGNHLNIFLEYVPGGSVAALLNNYGAFEEALVRNFVRQILTGLNYLHEREIVHRDIKGANILVDNKGGIKISDFGISKKVENTLIQGFKANRPSLQGSAFWMAPEVVKQTSYTSKADIWSVGCLVVEMLTGTHPWAELTQMQAIYRIGTSARPATPNDISPESADFLNKTFEIDHTKRPTAKELLEHPFIATRSGGNFQGAISVAQAQATMAAAHQAARGGMALMGRG